MNLKSITEMILTEEVALTKGSQRVMNDKNLVAGLADAVRDDARSHPAAFPHGFAKQSQKTPDPELAHWFLENIDRIEKAGYEGTVYSRDGVNSDWIVRRYIAGSHNWEDLTGVMNMNLRDWYVLKSRDLLDPAHKDLPKFNSVRDLGRYITTHYNDKLTDVREKAKRAADAKKSKTIKLVDNDDYKIYASLNRKAAQSVGLGTQWCTGNSNTAAHWDRYANEAMLFQFFPKSPEKVDKVSDFNGKHIVGDEKYQFGADRGFSFKDIADDQVKPADIRAKYPYLYKDLVSALETNKPKIEQAFKELSADPELQHSDYKVKTYDIDQEIKKLHGFVDSGYFTDKVRPKEKVAKDDNGLHSVWEPGMGPHSVWKQGMGPHKDMAMESIRELARLMLEGKYPNDEEITGYKAQRIWDFKNVFIELADITPTDEPFSLTDAYNKMGVPLGSRDRFTKQLQTSSPHRLEKVGINSWMWVFGEELEEDDAATEPESQGIGGSLGSTGGGSGDSTTKYAPGTAPSMPESHNIIGNEIMEKNIDKDVAAMLSSLKKLDKLTESCAPVLMARPKLVNEEDKHKPEWLEKAEKKAEKKEEVKEDAEDNPWKKLAKKEEPSSHSGKTVKTSSGVRHEHDYDAKDDKKGNIDGDDDDLEEAVRGITNGPSGNHLPVNQASRDAIAKGIKSNRETNRMTGNNKGIDSGKGTYDGPDVSTMRTNEGVDPEVLEWMNRFAKLGNMKGYGR